MKGVINADPDQAVRSYRSLRLLSVVLIVCSVVGFVLGHGWLTLVCAILAVCRGEPIRLIQEKEA